jgi:hypothetical protein
MLQEQSQHNNMVEKVKLRSESRSRMSSVSLHISSTDCLAIIIFKSCSGHSVEFIQDFFIPKKFLRFFSNLWGLDSEGADDGDS